MSKTKYIFVTGGVTSSLGKGIIGASLAKLLQARGLRVSIQKFDPYINIDPGTLNPFEHGECFVTFDGGETDLDLGHYERFLGVKTNKANNVTSGKIYQTVITNERKGHYLGKTVQVIPHITDEIKRFARIVAESGEFDIIITEIGGTVGDIESLPFIEAIRQMKWELGQGNCLVLHLTLLPYLKAAKELKTKPSQHSVKELLSLGIQPDILLCRTEMSISPEIRSKLALFCNLEYRAIIEAIDADSIYQVPLLMLEEKLDDLVLERLRIENNVSPNLTKWHSFLSNLKNYQKEITIALVGKYVNHHDAYLSIYEAFVHSGAHHACKVNIKKINSDDLENDNNLISSVFEDVDGILVAPGFGQRGFEGKIAAVKFAREKQIPFLGICFGMQVACVEFARNVCGLEGANSTEIDKETPYPIIDLMREQKNIVVMGGSMRLGAYPCDLEEGSLALKVYQQSTIFERHRHRYEFNNDCRSILEKNGMSFSGINMRENLVEIVEIPSHRWFIGVQFHPEYQSTIEDGHPLFLSFVGECCKK